MFPSKDQTQSPDHWTAGKFPLPDNFFNFVFYVTTCVVKFSYYFFFFFFFAMPHSLHDLSSQPGIEP